MSRTLRRLGGSLKPRGTRRTRCLPVRRLPHWKRMRCLTNTILVHISTSPSSRRNDRRPRAQPSRLRRRRHVNHIHKFYCLAYWRGREREPTAVETCHFSLICDLRSGEHISGIRTHTVGSSI
ncbi:hypothetical protein K469DRAFT_260053 [Zopfia rhizophila CBS 207.26]|uniref:Uncharacterized protein n=1 Tax=Zopfia rhizophila CBS 207.26 TaxID=1314779 RepID=A0A6A6DPN4_9PEZI|nr:hypothetical protein K469DRAFT_260053 [Zopfia rhizophila CBS 207.26]